MASNKLFSAAIKVVSGIIAIILGDVLERKIKDISKGGNDRSEKITEEAKTIVRIVLKVALADGLMSEKELDIIYKGLPKGSKLSRVDITSIATQEKKMPSDITELLKQIVTKQSAENVIELSAKVAYVDSDCTPEERLVLDNISKTLNIDSTKLLEYIDNAKKLSGSLKLKKG